MSSFCPEGLPPLPQPRSCFRLETVVLFILVPPVLETWPVVLAFLLAGGPVVGLVFRRYRSCPETGFLDLGLIRIRCVSVQVLEEAQSLHE